MKTMILAASVVSLLLSGVVMSASIPERSKSPTAENGYLTVGESVIVLPERLKTGDQVHLYNVKGVSVFDRTVGEEMTTAPLTSMSDGMYQLVISRNGAVITQKNVPISGENR